MTDKQHEGSATPQEQIVYANLLLIGVWFGLFLLVVTYTLYLTGILPPHVPIHEVPNTWGVGVDQYLHDTQSPNGWGWISFLGTGDFLNFVGFAFLALTTLACYLVLMRAYASRKDWIYFAICGLEIVVLAVAASGLLGAGGH